MGASIGVSKVFDDGRQEGYTLKPKNDYEARLDALERIVRDCQTSDCLGVVVENPMGHHYNVLRMHMQMLGALVMACHILRVPCVAVNVSEIKKAATGKGNADKAQMIDAARARFGQELDEHQADAAHCAGYGWDAGVFR